MIGVGHPEIGVTSRENSARVALLFAIRLSCEACELLQLLWSATLGVGHPVESLADVVSADAVCAQYGRPAGVAFSTQVCRYTIKPPLANRCCNLFPNDMFRAALGDELEESGPEVPLVLVAELLARAGVGLAWAATSPDGFVSGPSCELKSERPATDSCKEMALEKTRKIGWLDFKNAAGIDMAVRYKFVRDELFKPRGGRRVKFVVIVHQTSPSPVKCFTSFSAIRMSRISVRPLYQRTNFKYPTPDSEEIVLTFFPDSAIRRRSFEERSGSVMRGR